MSHVQPMINEIKTMLTALQYSGNPAFKQVLDYPTQQFSGYPSATIVRGEVTSAYDTQKQNMRNYQIMIYLWFDMEESDDAVEFVRSNEYVDLVLDAIDNSEDLNATCDFLEPIGMQAYTQPVEEAGQKLVAPIKLNCKKTIDLF